MFIDPIPLSSMKSTSSSRLPEIPRHLFCLLNTVISQMAAKTLYSLSILRVAPIFGSFSLSNHH
uniref:Uncharacterized protein n=1 Tax=Octopus bimaculoides TaxID=37653 RepID=A0A0L8FMD0_OCTBM